LLETVEELFVLLIGKGLPIDQVEASSAARIAMSPTLEKSSEV